MSGYTLSYRAAWTHPVFRNKAEAAVFKWMCDAAQWQPTRMSTKFGPIDLQRGELIIAERELAEDFCMHRNTIRTLVRKMIDDGMIEVNRDRTPHRAGTIVRIVNYDEYQAPNVNAQNSQDRSGTVNGTAVRTEEGPKKDRSGTKNNEYNEVKEDNGGGVITPACTHEAQPEPATPPPADKTDPRAHIPLWKSVLTVMGVIDDPRWSGSGHLCAAWVKQGIPDEIILETITAEMAKLRARGQGPPVSLKYFDRAVTQAHADASRPLPEPDHARPSSPPVTRTGRQYGSGYTQDDLRRSIVAGIAGGLDPGGTVAGEDQPSGCYRAASAV